MMPFKDKVVPKIINVLLTYSKFLFKGRECRSHRLEKEHFPPPPELLHSP